MLQSFCRNVTRRNAGNWINVCFQCEDALALYRDSNRAGIQTRNVHLWKRLVVVR